jgi:DNA-binding CsgD family transcriptional regulator
MAHLPETVALPDRLNHAVCRMAFSHTRARRTGFRRPQTTANRTDPQCGDFWISSVVISALHHRKIMEKAAIRCQELLQAIHAVCKLRYTSRRQTKPDSPELSDRERQVLQPIAEGNSTKEIAATLTISVKTAESHRQNVMIRLGIHDTAGLVRYAIRHGLAQA